MCIERNTCRCMSVINMILKFVSFEIAVSLVKSIPYMVQPPIWKSEIYSELKGKTITSKVSLISLLQLVACEYVLHVCLKMDPDDVSAGFS